MTYWESGIRPREIVIIGATQLDDNPATRPLYFLMISSDRSAPTFLSLQLLDVLLGVTLVALSSSFVLPLDIGIVLPNYRIGEHFYKRLLMFTKTSYPP